jgi:hypothetical protein
VAYRSGRIHENYEWHYPISTKRETIYSRLSFATEFCNIQVIDFFEIRKWLQKGYVLQQFIDIAALTSSFDQLKAISVLWPMHGVLCQILTLSMA